MYDMCILFEIQREALSPTCPGVFPKGEEQGAKAVKG
jgi:hypothetical protein